MTMLTQNSELRPLGIFNWTLPAWVVRDSSGKAVNVCPTAGACVKVCYARNGTYNFRHVRAAHVRNLERVRDDLAGWMVEMLDELGHKRYRPSGRPTLPDLPRDHLAPTVAELLDAGAALVRIHDGGDFFSEEYLLAWLSIAAQTPDVLFYCYTKRVSMFKAVVEEHAPDNFLWCYSTGGREDGLIDRERDYHADVFPNDAAIEEAGYYNQDAHDLLCVVAPTNRIGIPANNIPHFRKLMDGRTFSQMQEDREAHRPSRPTLFSEGAA